MTLRKTLGSRLIHAERVFATPATQLTVFSFSETADLAKKG